MSKFKDSTTLRVVNRTMKHTWLAATISTFFADYFVTFVNESSLNYKKFFPESVHHYFGRFEAGHLFN